MNRADLVNVRLIEKGCILGIRLRGANAPCGTRLQGQDDGEFLRLSRTGARPGNCSLLCFGHLCFLLLVW